MASVFNVVLAGGSGTRFWPYSRMHKPKHLLRLTGEDQMIVLTVNRLDNAPSDTFVITNASQAKDVISALQGRPLHVVVEPAPRNTAACIGYAALLLQQEHHDAIMCIFPADHYIGDVNQFNRTVLKAVEVAAQSDSLVTIGLRPTYPATGYGYIEIGKELTPGVFCVDRFIEKPGPVAASKYMEGQHLWNSGMFAWKVSTILEQFRLHLPEVYNKLQLISDALGSSQEQDVIQQVYPTMPNISIDYGILEKAADVVVVPGDFGWSDVGSWDALAGLYEQDAQGNVVRGQTVMVDTCGSIIHAKDRLIATVGLSGVIVVETEDAILVCSKERAQDVKQVVEKLKEQGLTQYL